MLIIGQSCVAICELHKPPRSVRQSAAAAPRAACTILHVLHHLSFIGSRYGAVAFDASGIPEQQRTFFGSLDIVSSDPAICEELLAFLARMCGGVSI